MDDTWLYAPCQKDPIQGNAAENWCLTTFLPLILNLLTRVIAEEIYDYLEQEKLLPEDKIDVEKEAVEQRISCLLMRLFWRITRKGTQTYLWPAIPHLNPSHRFWDQPPHPPIINVICKYLREFLGGSFCVATLSISWNIEYGPVA